jgi:hypothetical protein
MGCRALAGSIIAQVEVRSGGKFIITDDAPKNVPVAIRDGDPPVAVLAADTYRYRKKARCN